MDPLLLVLSCTSCYIGFHHLNILKYLSRLIKPILKIVLLRVYIGCFYGWNGFGRMVRIYECDVLKSVLHGDVSVI
jgi:hypothetical protein